MLEQSNPFFISANLDDLACQHAQNDRPHACELYLQDHNMCVIHFTCN